ncbi:MAG: glycoside hydrolase family 95 protein [Clostridia bacterium]|nr:glycoside hydrolase family 95 protein [Clostridia bacterium]
MLFNSSKGGKIYFALSPLISFCGDYCITEGDGCGRSGEVLSTHTDVVMRGISDYYNIKYEGRVRVKAYGGKIVNENGTIRLKNADRAEIFFTCGTNYRMEKRVFEESSPKRKLAPYPGPSEAVLQTLNAACAKGYDALKIDHIKDYSSLFGRVHVSWGGKYTGTPTNELLEAYKRGEESRYLEELLFQYGRYLLIASSRPGGYPANLQGTWCAYDSPPWGSDYHHNINVQMNYWPAHVANLAECFTAYDDYAHAYMPLAQKNADRYILQNFPDKFGGRGTCGWTIGTAATLYTISAPQARSHSGPGTGAFTSLLFWQHYDFTRDKKYLQETAYPYLLEMSRFLMLVLEEDENGKLLAGLSASPEQIHNGEYYITKGCAFDQQMIYENFDKTLAAANILGIKASDEPLLEKISKALPRLDPVLIGADKQVKEYREESGYGEIGERHHRHISHLVSLYPGTAINRKTPDWIEAAKVTLDFRGDRSTGWATAHRLCLWARTGAEEHAYRIYRTFIKDNTLPNLWGTHPPFQIDGNFGVTAGVCEMLIQSNSGYIELLPALPDAWRSGHFKGLCARGGFILECEWENKRLKEIYVTSTVGGVCRLKFKGANRAALDNIEFSIDGNIMFFPTIKGERLRITIQ